MSLTDKYSGIWEKRVVTYILVQRGLVPVMTDNMSYYMGTHESCWRQCELVLIENYSGSMYQLLPGAINPQVLSTVLLFCLWIFLLFLLTCTSILFFVGPGWGAGGGILFQQPPNCSPALRTTFLQSALPTGTKEVCQNQESSHIICPLDKTL